MEPRMKNLGAPRSRWMQSQWLIASLLVASVFASAVAAGDDFERPPIHYSKAKPNNRVERLQEKLATGKLPFPFHPERGYLSAVLKALDIPEASQVLVFSKTSLQRQRIAPYAPRAIYFNDDVYVGFCRAGQVLEFSAVDPHLGAVFYTLDQEETGRAKFVRQTDACMLCHASSQTRNVPGHTLRSIFTDRGGEPIYNMGSIRVDQTTPIEHRWAGWFVTGTHGNQTHRGNLIIKSRFEREAIKNPEGQNVADLKSFFDVSRYLSPHSDIVALMVLEHQAEAQNLIARASIQCRLAMHEQAAIDKERGQDSETFSVTTARQIRSVGEPLVRYLLFSDEAKLTDKIQGTSSFAAEFVKQGPRAKNGRSLREFDLQRRIFKYPCSYLIYSEQFEQLPVPMKQFVYRQMHDVLTNRHSGSGFGHLSEADRQAILEILRETKNDLPDYWRN